MRQNKITMYFFIALFFSQYLFWGQKIIGETKDSSVYSNPKSQSTELKHSDCDTIILKDIRNNSSTNWSTTIPIIVVIVGGLLAIYSVKLNTINSARINWIENLRDNLSSYVSYISQILDLLDYIADQKEQGKNIKKLMNEIDVLENAVDEINKSRKVK